jgi:maleate isomerase
MELDRGYGTLARLAMIVLSTDETIENEARLVLRDRPVSLVHSRVPAHADVTPDTLKLMEAALPETAALLPKDQDVIAYACTSGATVIGPGVVADLIQGAHPEAKVTNPITAVVAACQALGVGSVAYVSPYVPSVTQPMRLFLAGHGIETLVETSFRIKEDRAVARIQENITKNMALNAVVDAKPEAIFVSCTNLRTFGILQELERETGLPVISSNQALLWHMLKLAGVDATGWGPGRLFEV